MLNFKYIVFLGSALLLSVAVWFIFFAKELAPDFTAYAAGPERKTAFFNYFTPIIVDANKQLAADRRQIQKICDKGNSDAASLESYLTKYRIDDADLQQESACQLLLRRADVVPVSLALAQAANESAWGTSRFAKQGNNFFGQWCFTKGCGIVPQSRDKGKAHEVADFRSPADSVESYMMNLNRHDAYKPLRTIRQSLREKGFVISGLPLTHGLNKYSERGEEYGKELRDMITFNDLTRFDTASD
ncbi:MAG: flagellar biosynthesis protein FlgJ [Aestuariibacter sp.]|uniref:Flagellar biosynthesis protein FlgJ n=1 Tax=Alteromonas alba TaxID=2079529 RepID=A0A2S9VCE9_9ALTE|nr:flagellar biosynthesis protein FlgJ [Alteromonas sp. RW2A1]AUC89190.1 flagellar biosynthesis protein FlgJ [Alteromonas sp. MB-3u-76]MCP4232159.1 flagellar biosynthesis protein FlgJ [Aestuariibacter sp.]PRO74139.1 flagellar biosynthesis protein FlgJ [Alteromonas alba]HBA56848.1 flagellar biosynthesis protein FlgJ [Alteromonas macleodii]